jgi:hypothetical protein
MWRNETSSELTDEVLINWIRSVIPVSEDIRALVSIQLSPLSGAGGLSAQMLKIYVDSPSGPKLMDEPLTFILKMNHLNSLDSSKLLGTAREAYFYTNLAGSLLDDKVETPAVYYAKGDMSDGSYRLLLEDLSLTAVQSGYFFGPGSPLNWGKDLPALLSTVQPPITFREVAVDTFIQMARMHRKYWRKTSLLHEHSWLRGRGYYHGEDEDHWQREQTRASLAWLKCKEQIANKTSQIKWNEHLIACVDASLAKSNWEDFLAEKKSRAWTLVHGDMHPANVLWDWLKPSVTGITPKGTSIFVDWAMVGVGSGPQDMAQYIISHTSPTDRRLIERELMMAYYLELTTIPSTGIPLHEDLASKSYSFDDCWRDYIHGGVQRWVWLFCVLTTLCPDIVNQYFHDQLVAFLQDHEITPDNIGIPL